MVRHPQSKLVASRAARIDDLQYPPLLSQQERARMQERQRAREMEAARRESAELLGWASEVASRSGGIVDSFVTMGKEVGCKPKPKWLPQKQTALAQGGGGGGGGIAQASKFG